jgi:hypothetical protein
MTTKIFSFISLNKVKLYKNLHNLKTTKRFSLFSMNKLAPNHNARILFIPLLNRNNE